MNQKSKTADSTSVKTSGALTALKRAAKQAIAVARQTGTHAYVMENGKIVDAARLRVRATKNGSSRAKK